MQPNESHPTPTIVQDAGLVLLSPFLPHLFAQAGVVAEGTIVPGKEGKAGALLHYAGSGQAAGAARLSPLVLILCGLPAEADVRGDTLSPADLHLVDAMLAAVRQNWPMVRETSTTALRETFLQRDGRLDTSAEDRAQLRVQRKTVDVLVDQVPWSFSMVYHRWMPRPLHVTW